MRTGRLSLLPLTQTFFALLIVFVVGFLAVTSFKPLTVGHDTFASDTEVTFTTEVGLNKVDGPFTAGGSINDIGGSFLPAKDGNVYVRPQEAAKQVLLGDINTKGTKLGTSLNTEFNQVGPHTWLPWADGNTYIRPGKENREVLIGDWWTGGTRLGTGGDVKFNQVGPQTWLPYTDGNSYIRPGQDRKAIVVGDMWTDNVYIGQAGRTNTTVRGMLKVNRGDGDRYPGGWGQGVHSWDVYANGTIAVGQNGSINSYMDQNVVNAKNKLCIDNECISKADLIKLRNQAK